MRQLRSRHLLILFVVLTVSVLATQASEFRTRLAEPIVIFGQIFDGSVLELSPVAQGNTHAVLVDGRTVALVFRHAVDRCPDGADSAGFLMSTDALGRMHLVGIHWTDRDSGRVEQRPFRYATVAIP